MFLVRISILLSYSTPDGVGGGVGPSFYCYSTPVGVSRKNIPQTKLLILLSSSPSQIAYRCSLFGYQFSSLIQPLSGFQEKIFCGPNFLSSYLLIFLSSYPLPPLRKSHIVNPCSDINSPLLFNPFSLRPTRRGCKKKNIPQTKLLILLSSYPLILLSSYPLILLSS